MKPVHLLFSAVQFLFTLLILLIGGFFIGLHYAPHLRLIIGQFFVEQSANFVPIGLSVLGCGVLLLIGFYAMNRGAYFQFIVPAQNMVIESALFRTYVKKYWAERFPETALSTDVALLANQKMEIFLEMPPLQIEDQEAFLIKTEKDLKLLLTKTLGYRGDFLLTLIVK